MTTIDEIFAWFVICYVTLRVVSPLIHTVFTRIQTSRVGAIARLGVFDVKCRIRHSRFFNFVTHYFSHTWKKTQSTESIRENDANEKKIRAVDSFDVTTFVATSPIHKRHQRRTDKRRKKRAHASTATRNFNQSLQNISSCTKKSYTFWSNDIRGTPKLGTYIFSYLTLPEQKIMFTVSSSITRVFLIDPPESTASFGIQSDKNNVFLHKLIQNHTIVQEIFYSSSRETRAVLSATCRLGYMTMKQCYVPTLEINVVHAPSNRTMTQMNLIRDFIPSIQRGFDIVENPTRYIRYVGNVCIQWFLSFTWIIADSTVVLPSIIPLQRKHISMLSSSSSSSSLVLSTTLQPPSTLFHPFRYYPCGIAHPPHPWESNAFFWYKGVWNHRRGCFPEFLAIIKIAINIRTPIHTHLYTFAIFMATAYCLLFDRGGYSPREESCFIVVCALVTFWFTVRYSHYAIAVYALLIWEYTQSYWSRDTRRRLAERATTSDIVEIGVKTFAWIILAHAVFPSTFVNVTKLNVEVDEILNIDSDTNCRTTFDFFTKSNCRDLSNTNPSVGALCVVTLWWIWFCTTMQRHQTAAPGYTLYLSLVFVFLPDIINTDSLYHDSCKQFVHLFGVLFLFGALFMFVILVTVGVFCYIGLRFFISAPQKLIGSDREGKNSITLNQQTSCR